MKPIVFLIFVIAINLVKSQQFNNPFNSQTNQQFQNQNQNQQQQQQQQQQQMQTNEQSGQLQQSIYQFLKSNQRTTRFVELIDRVSQTTDQSLLSILSDANNRQSFPSNSNQNGITVFVPVNEAFSQLPNDLDQVKNDLGNLVFKERLSLERLRQLNGQNLSRTFGYRPRLFLRTVKNFYLLNRNFDNSISNTVTKQMFRRQINNNFNQQQQQFSSTLFPGQQLQSSTFYPNQQIQIQSQNNTSLYETYSQLNQKDGYNSPVSTKLPSDEIFLLNNAIIIDRFELLNGNVYLINSYPRFYDKSLLLLLQDNDINGLAQNVNFWITRAIQSISIGDENLKNALNAFGSNTYFLPVDQALTKFNDRDKINNNTYLFNMLFKSHRVSNRILFDYYLDEPQSTFFTDTGLPIATRHSRSSSGQEEIEISIGHVKGRILPEYRNIYCASGVIHLIDTVLGLPSKSAYQEISQVQELSSFRSIIDRSQKYKQLLEQTPSQALYSTQRMITNKAKTFTTTNRKRRQITMAQQSPNTNNMLQPQFNQPQSQFNQGFQQPSQQQTFNNPLFQSSQQQQQQQSFNSQGFQFQQQQQFNQQSSLLNNFGFNNDGFRLMTILAPNDAALIAIKDELFKNESSIDEFISNHIIVDNQNKIFYTDHDDSIFQNSQSYSTMNSNFMLTAQINQDNTGVNNIVSLHLNSNPSIKTTIINGNSRVSNGVVHIVDRALTQITSSDITSLLDKYSSQNSPGNPAFSQFVEALRITGIFNDLKQPSKKYTLFIPTNEALSRYQDIINSNDLEKKRKLLYRHICMDQNLPSNLLQGQGLNQPNQNQNQPQQQQPQTQYDASNQLICRNVLGQDLTLTRDQNGLVSKWKDMASSKILNDFSGIFSSAYVLEKPLLNQNLPNYGLNNLNNASKYEINKIIICFAFLFTFYLN